jgi:hypothetical protein
MGTAMLERQHTSSITVTIVTMGSGTTRYVGEASLTLGRLLEELDIDGHTDVRVNGATAERAYRLIHGDQVVILPRIRGGAR